MKSIEDLKTSKERVAHVLKLFPETRDSDTKLFTLYYYIFHGELVAKLNDSFSGYLKAIDKGDIPCFETIRRSRQLVQAEGLFCGSRCVRLKRKQLEEKIRNGVTKL